MRSSLATFHGCRDVLSALALLVLPFGAAGCSRNYGTAPSPVGIPVVVVAEEGAGPVLDRALTSFAAGNGPFWVGTDRGLYQAIPAGASLHWIPLHPGLISPEGVAGVRPIQELAASPDGRVALHRAGFSSDDFLFVTRDGGHSYRGQPLPSVVDRVIAGLQVAPPVNGHPEGLLLVLQGGRLYAADPAEETWRAATTPAVPLRLGPVAANSAGVLLVSVETVQGGQLWQSEDGASSFHFLADASGPVLDLALASSGAAVAALPSGVETNGRPLWESPSPVRGADLRFSGSTLQLLAWVESTVPPDSLLRIDLPGTILGRWAVPEGGLPWALALRAKGGWIGDRSCNLWELGPGSPHEHRFDGSELDMGALAPVPSSAGAVLLSDAFGRVWLRRSSGTLEGRGQAFGSNRVWSVLPDPAQTGAIFAGSYGCYWQAGPGQPWERRNQGQFSYLLQNYSDPVLGVTLAAQPDDPVHLWLGSSQGNGPYESLDGGRLWTRVHGGLGAPGTLSGEDGLPAITEVRAFAFVDDEVWMGGYRGGVWRRAGGDGPWTQRNRGLPDISGTPVDSCCFEPLARQIDVRDLCVLGDGRLLAATSWGVYRSDRGRERWELSSVGLSNGDAYSLARHPFRPDWILLGCRGSDPAPEWLFLSRDGGRSWRPVDSMLRSRWARRVCWTGGTVGELIALIDGGGAWRMEIQP